MSELRSANPTKIVVRLAVFGAASAALGFFKLPGPVGTIALDSLPGYWAAAYFGPLSGAAIGGIGHLASAVSAGFPLSIPIHLYIAAHMFVWCLVFGLIVRRLNSVLGLFIAGVAAIALNGVGTPVLLLPLGDRYQQLFPTLVVFLLIASAVNVILAAFLVRIMSRFEIPGL